MREPTIARNYAETLLALATRAEDLDGWGAMLREVVRAVRESPRVRLFLESPRVSPAEKKALLDRAFQDRFPRLFARFLEAVVGHRRQGLLPQIAEEYDNLVDAAENRVHAEVTVARAPDDATRAALEEGLSRVLKKRVVPHFTVRPEIMGGAIVRVGDTLMDGSVRHRLRVLRGRLLGAGLQGAGVQSAGVEGARG